MDKCISQQGCPNEICVSYGKCDDANIAIHDKRLNRLRCRSCGKTWSSHREEFYFGLRTSLVKICRSVDMLKAGIPIRKIARLVDVDAGTIMRWKKKLDNQ